ncbi:hypothetical protein ACHAWO_013568 [Cyclotella atomus]|uniref:Uncharacterized protein n=1 Tax=Cyclotella atomus TaxID=382360 RepID=A0ABD3N1V2_9STRA
MSSGCLVYPKSYSTWCQNLAYSKCNTACSAPPTYKSTGIQSSSNSGLKAALSFFGSKKRK